MKEIDPTRLDALIDGAPPEGGAETNICALLERVRELELSAPPDLRARILEHTAERPAREPRGRRVRAWFAPPRLAIAGSLAAAAIAAVVVVPNIGNDGSPSVDGALRESDPTQSVDSSVQAAPGANARSKYAVPSPNDAQAVAPGASPAESAAPPIGARTNRVQEVRSSTRVQVADVQALSKASSEAMREVRRLGGYTVSSRYAVPNGGRGDNSLVFRVPVARAEAAITAFGGLGTVLSQQADMRDLTQAVTTQNTEISRLEKRAEELRTRLAAQPTDALRAQLAAVEAQLKAGTARSNGLKQRGEFARLSLDLTTEGPPAAVEPDGQIEGSLRRSGARLASVGAWTLGAGVLLAPFALVGGVGLVGVRTVRRRSRQRDRDLI
jgi:Domain of unknown function (DUF4349)